MQEEEQLWDNEEKYFEEGNVDDRPKKLKEKIFEWCQKGDLIHLKKYINDKQVNINDTDVNGWTPIQWGIVNNQVPIVKVILEKLYNKKEIDQVNHDGDDDVEIPDRIKNVFGIDKNGVQTNQETNFDLIFKKPHSTAENKYTPLHWSAYKGNMLITSILLKYKFSPNEVDMYGNTALHQAAASNNISMFKLIMGLGMDLETKNARSHCPNDLTSNDEIKKLIKKVTDAQQCLICKQYFSFVVKKYVCKIDSVVICKDCCFSDYFYETKNSEYPEILECRCKNCINLIKKEEENLIELLELNNLLQLETKYKEILSHQIQINPKLKVKAEIEIDRLQRETKILNHIKSLENVENHKTIEKSVFILLEELEDAKINGVILDQKIVEKALKYRDNKVAEKELRRLLSNVTIFDASEELRRELEERISLAVSTNVDKKFIDDANLLLEKVYLHLNCLDVYNKLSTYPPREYVPKDPNAGKKKKPEPPKKKKKKEAPFPTPEWAKTSKQVKEKLDEYIKFIKMGEEIGLKEEFTAKLKEIQARFKLEIEHLKGEEEEQRLLDEEKAKKAKKKK